MLEDPPSTAQILCTSKVADVIFAGKRIDCMQEANTVSNVDLIGTSGMGNSPAVPAKYPLVVRHAAD